MRVLPLKPQPCSLLLHVACIILLVACGRRAGPVALSTTVTAPAWVLSSEVESEQLLQDRCWDLAPPEVMELDNPSFRDCFMRGHLAIERGWRRVYVHALQSCVEAQRACCFERLPEDYDAIPVIRDTFHNLYSEPTLAERTSACNTECASRIGHPPESSTCNPSVIRATHDMDRYRTAALRAVVSECDKNPDAIAKCALLAGILIRASCELECRQAAIPVVAKPPSSCDGQKPIGADQAACGGQKPIRAVQAARE
jgi:hypothetical protein